MLKQNASTLTNDLQVSDLSAKLMLTLLVGQGGNPAKFVNSKKLAYLLGGKGKWSNYRHKKMEFLERIEYVISIKAKNKSGKGISWHYSIHPNIYEELVKLAVS